jgi:hypothetical protein
MSMKTKTQYPIHTSLILPFIEDDDDGLPLLLNDSADIDPVGFGSLEGNAKWLVKHWLTEASARRKLRKVWAELKPTVDKFLSWQEGLVGGPYLALLVYMQLWNAGKLGHLRRCAYEPCGRIFFARTGRQTHCSRKCLKAKIVASYDTDSYRERKKLAIRRARTARKAMDRAAQDRAKRRKYGQA